MPLLSLKESLKLKLRCIPLPQLKILVQNLGISKHGSAAEIIKRILKKHPPEKIIDEFIKKKYTDKIQKRQLIISDEDLKKELLKVKTFSWGVVQGQLDQKVQAEYVRRIFRYEELFNNVKAKLYDDVNNYVICTWYNHWTTILIEEHIGLHPKVVPTIKNIKGIDIFFDGQPFDLKVTYPREYIGKYGADKMLESPQHLAVWMYENQGAQRFGADNRLFVVVLDKNNPERSWELKRYFNLVFSKMDDFFGRESVSKKDEVVFTFGRKTYTAVTKVLIITK